MKVELVVQHGSSFQRKILNSYCISLAGQPLHKRGRVWSTSHHGFVLQSQQWVSSTRCGRVSMLFAVSRDAVLARLFGVRHTEYASAQLVCVHSTSYYTSMRVICG